MKNLRLFITIIVCFTAFMVNGDSVNISRIISAFPDPMNQLYLTTQDPSKKIIPVHEQFDYSMYNEGHGYRIPDVAYYVDGDLYLHDKTPYAPSYGSEKSEHQWYNTGSPFYPATGNLESCHYTFARSARGITYLVLKLTIEKNLPPAFSGCNLINCVKHPEFPSTEIIKPRTGFYAVFTDTNIQLADRKYTL